MLGRVFGDGSLAAQHAARAEHFLELWVLRIRKPLRLFLGVEMIKVPEILIETVDHWEILIQVAQVILTELTGRITLSFQKLSHSHVAVLKSDGGAGCSDF